MNGELTNISIAVVIEARAVDHPWMDEEWVVVEVFPAPLVIEPRSLPSENGRRYVIGAAHLDLHHTDTDAYLFNLTSRQPSLYVVLRECVAMAVGGPGLELVLVSANPYMGEHYLDTDGAQLHKIAMPAEICAELAKFVDANHHEVPFKKRKRDKGPRDEYLFGKEPISDIRARYGVAPSDGKNDGDGKNEQ